MKKKKSKPKKLHCPKCGAEIEPDEELCSECKLWESGAYQDEEDEEEDI